LDKKRARQRKKGIRDLRYVYIVWAGSGEKEALQTHF